MITPRPPVVINVRLTRLFNIFTSQQARPGREGGLHCHHKTANQGVGKRKNGPKNEGSPVAIDRQEARKRQGKAKVPKSAPLHVKPEGLGPFLDRHFGTRRPRPHPSDIAYYRPVPAAACHNFGNNGIAQGHHEMLKAVQDLSLHLNMATMDPNPHGHVSPQAAFMSPQRFRQAVKHKNSFSVIWDSGASISVTSDKNDFLGKIESVPVYMRLVGVARGLKIQGKGIVRWCIQGVDGQLRILELPALYIPDVKARLLSTNGCLQVYDGETIKLEKGKLTLSGLPEDPTRGKIKVYVDGGTNLPISMAYVPGALNEGVAALNNLVATVHADNLNLTEAEKELLVGTFDLATLDSEEHSLSLELEFLQQAKPSVAFTRLPVKSARLPSVRLVCSESSVVHQLLDEPSQPSKIVKVS